MSSRFSIRMAWCSSWAMELLTHSCQAVMSFFCPDVGAGSSYLHSRIESFYGITLNFLFLLHLQKYCTDRQSVFFTSSCWGGPLVVERLIAQTHSSWFLSETQNKTGKDYKPVSQPRLGIKFQMSSGFHLKRRELRHGQVTQVVLSWAIPSGLFFHQRSGLKGQVQMISLHFSYKHDLKMSHNPWWSNMST